jgi:UDP-GlcNAc:undecaprenyl-phosphate GlcNAc-1-phosphate transferase
MNNLLLLVPFFATGLIILMMLPFAPKLGLMDTPNYRKQHGSKVPLIGGISVYIGIMASVLMFTEGSGFMIFLITAGSLLLIGIVDDLVDVDPKIRLILYTLLLFISLYFDDIKIMSLGDILGFGVISLGMLSIPFTVFAIMGGMTSYNFMDGMDGVLGVISVITLAIISWLSYEYDVNDLYMLSNIMLSAMLCFLVFNLMAGKRKVFLGDSGSVMVGFSVSWMLVILSQNPINAIYPITVLYILSIPVMDIFSVIYRRKRRGVSLMKPDNSHIHHILKRTGMKEIYVLATIGFGTFLMAFIGIFLQKTSTSEVVMFILYLVILFLYVAVSSIINTEHFCKSNRQG